MSTAYKNSCGLDSLGCGGDPHATCTDGENSRSCPCPPGFLGTATLTNEQKFAGCVDIDGCSLDFLGGCGGDTNATCEDTGGNSRECVCAPGYSPKGLSKLTDSDKFA